MSTTPETLYEQSMERKNHMNPQPNPPMPDAGAINQRVKKAVRSHRLKLRVLTAAAFVFGFVAIAASVFIVWFYLIIYLPKQREMLNWSQTVVQQAGTSTDSAEKGVKRIDNLLRNEVILTHVVSMGVTVVALAVSALGLGTLILLTVVVLNRRIALNQINASLAQISNQLRELQTGRGSA
jgi:Na+/citrate or Na+/malate symporter